MLFAHDTAHTNQINQTRYAIRGFFDGRTKYARYYGIGGGKPGTGLWGKDPGHKLFDVDAAFADQEHEWYDHQEDPHELVNLAHDRARRAELKDNYHRLQEYERVDVVTPRVGASLNHRFEWSTDASGVGSALEDVLAHGVAAHGGGS